MLCKNNDTNGTIYGYPVRSSRVDQEKKQFSTTKTIPLNENANPTDGGFLSPRYLQIITNSGN